MVVDSDVTTEELTIDSEMTTEARASEKLTGTAVDSTDKEELTVPVVDSKMTTEEKELRAIVVDSEATTEE